MLSLLVILSFIFGTILGSFLLVVTLRYQTGKSLQGRSRCFSCGHTLSWYELVPVLSYLSQKGRCRSCSSHIPVETILVELGTGIVFAALATRAFFVGQTELMWNFDYLAGTLYLFTIFSVLVVIFLYDLKHKIIPDRLSFIFALLALIGSFFFSFRSGVYLWEGFSVPGLWHVLGGILVPLPFYLIWKFSKGRMMGLGDPKLMVGMGFLFGVLGGISAVFVSFWIGTLFIISTLIINNIFSGQLFGSSREGIMKQEVPFGPFLVLGSLVTLIFHIQLF